MKEVAPLAAVGLGIFLVLLSALWGLIFPASNSWTEEKSQRMSELTGKTHSLLFQAQAEKENPRSGNPGEAQAAYRAAKAELQTLRQEFENKRDRPQTVSQAFRWTGIALVLLGGVGVMIGRSG